MAVNDNQTVRTSREQVIDRMSARYPDRAFLAENGEYAENGEELLHQSILETLEEGNIKNAKLRELLFTDPRSSEFLQKWIESGDPRQALVEEFGDDLQELSTEEGRSQYKDQLKSWRDRKAENDKLSAEADANWNNSLQALEDWGNAKGLSQEEKVDIMLSLVSIAANGLMNKYGTDDFEMAYKAKGYDQAVSDARREGEVTGRNARIDENKKRRVESGNVMPPALSSQGRRVAEAAPKKESPWSGIE